MGALGRGRRVVVAAATAGYPCWVKEVAVSIDVEALGEDYCVTHDDVIVRIDVENLYFFCIFSAVSVSREQASGEFEQTRIICFGICHSQGKGRSNPLT